jgi:tRNA-Thr(GGU) m(6)t(6)A37 methyltransferase TsaA
MKKRGVDLKPCVNHPDRETSYVCMKHDIYMCEECMECRDPEIYCKFRSSCPIDFITRRKGNLDGDQKIKEAPMEIIEYRPIGIIHSPHKTPQGSPIQPTAAKGIEGKIEIFPEFAEGLEDLAGFSHIFLIYHFHLSKKFSLKVKPFLDDNQRGLFATRAPARPNPIGISVVRLVKIEKGHLDILNVDVVDGTPLLDIKPYVPAFDVHTVDKIGWIEDKTGKIKEAVDDGRFLRE